MVNVQPLLGPMLIGTYLNSILYGILIVQVLTYYQKHRYRDEKATRYLVLYLFICEGINTLCDIGMMYEPLIARFGTERAATRLPILFTADPLLTVLISTPVQLYICWRIKKLFEVPLTNPRFRGVPYLIALLSLCSFSGGISVSVANGHIPKYTQLVDSRPSVILWLVSSAVVDVSITICLVHSYRMFRTGFKRTDDMLNKMIRFAIHTGSVTSLFAFLDYLIFQVDPKTTINFTFDFALGKLYSNSLLSTLNARDYFAGKDDEEKATYNILFGLQESVQSTSSSRPIPVPSAQVQVSSDDIDIELQFSGDDIDIESQVSTHHS